MIYSVPKGDQFLYYESSQQVVPAHGGMQGVMESLPPLPSDSVMVGSGAEARGTIVTADVISTFSSLIPAGLAILAIWWFGKKIA